MIATIEGMVIDVDTGLDGEPRQRVIITLQNAGAFMPTDELQCLAGAGAIVRVDITQTTAAAALPPMLSNPGE